MRYDCLTSNVNRHSHSLQLNSEQKNSQNGMLCGSIRCSWQDPSVALKVTNNQQINRRPVLLSNWARARYLKWEDGGELMMLRTGIFLYILDNCDSYLYRLRADGNSAQHREPQNMTRVSGAVKTAWERLDFNLRSPSRMETNIWYHVWTNLGVTHNFLRWCPTHWGWCRCKICPIPHYQSCPCQREE